MTVFWRKPQWMSGTTEKLLPSSLAQIVVLEASVPRTSEVFDFRKKVLVAFVGAGLLFQNAVLVS